MSATSGERERERDHCGGATAALISFLNLGNGYGGKPPGDQTLSPMTFLIPNALSKGGIWMFYVFQGDNSPNRSPGVSSRVWLY